jgi:predicted membrane protein
MSAHRTQGRIFWGLMLICLGVLFLLDQMGRLDFGDLVGRFWPVIFIIIGVSILLSNNFKNVGSGIFFILFGAFFLLLKLHIFEHLFEKPIWDYLWPIAIIAVGLWLLLRPAWHPHKNEASAVGGDDLSISQVFSGTARKVESQNFRGGKADVVFGSAEIDLRNAKLAGGQATLVLSVVFGGIEVYVPRDWQVVLEGSPVLGSIDSHKKAATVPATQTLTVKGSAVFGSIEVKE